MNRITGNAVVGQSGGPTAVINQSLVGVIEAARASGAIPRLLGARHAIRGILTNDFVDLFAEPGDVLEDVARTPSSALGSVRHKPSHEECHQVFEVLRRHEVRFFFYIGGNDSAETVHIVHEAALSAGYDLLCFHIPKTVDNDLRVTDHCPGYGSAARFVASAFLGDDLDNRSLPGIKIDVVMGRHAGFLTAASALFRRDPDDGPHLIYPPERPFLLDRFLEDVEEVYRRLGRCVVAVSEGIVDGTDPAGRTVAETLTEKAAKQVERDTHANVQLSGSGMLGDWLADQVRQGLGVEGRLGRKLRIRADTFGYLQRSFPGVVSEVDAVEARECGRQAVRFALSGQWPDGSVVMLRDPGPSYRVSYDRTELRNVSRETRALPPEYLDPRRPDVTEAFLDYARPLAGPSPVRGRLRGMS
ncbi:MAG TPA: 6-phosphofructokinase [Myxococcota bacterium]|nr:6-phosphofructokinase [Myxococcota bacterium]HQK49736.1 6-phosphofructokinase [Myxococcota bacterium]